MELPVFEMTINPNEGSDVEVSFVALVEKPAIEKNFMMFKNQQLHFTVDADKRIISGPAMVADTLIYRRDQGGEYNVFFSADTIKQIALKFAKKGYAKNLNLFHDPAAPADGVTIFNSFVSDEAIGILPMKGFEDLPDGSWFISAKVENEEIWKKIKAGDIKGFSVEGNFSFKESEQLREKEHLQEKGLMSELKTLVSTLKAALFNTDVTPPVTPPATPQALMAKLKDGTEVSISELAVGGTVMVGDAPAPAGEHELEDGTKVVVGEGGVITEVVAAQATPDAVDYSKEFAAVNEKFANYESKFAAYESKFQEQAEAIKKAQVMNEKLFAIVEKLAEAPTADPVTPTNSFQSQKKIDRADRLAELTQSLNKLKQA